MTNERDDLQSKVTTLEDEVTRRDQQLQECQQGIEELSRQHKAAVDEGNSLQQMESLNKLEIIPALIVTIAILCLYRSAQSEDQVSW